MRSKVTSVLLDSFNDVTFLSMARFNLGGADRIREEEEDPPSNVSQPSLFQLASFLSIYSTF